MSFFSRYDVAAASRSEGAVGLAEGITGEGDGDDWVEAEIARLLSCDDNNEQVQEERGQSMWQAHKNDCQRDPNVSQIFSNYLLAEGSQGIDVQALLSDSLSPLQRATDIMAKNSTKKTDIEQVYKDVQCSEENSVGNAVQPDLSEDQVAFDHDMMTLDKTSALLTGIELSSSQVICDEKLQTSGQCIMLRDDASGLSLTQKCGGVGVSEEHPDMSEELRTTLDQLEADQKKWVEQLAKEQKEREADITCQIEETQKVIVEKQREETKKLKQLEHVRQKSALIIQAIWRGYSVYKVYHNELLHMKQLRQKRIFRAAQLLQANWRGLSNRKKYRPVLEARRVMRQQKLRQEAITRNLCATKIQTYWRGYHIRCAHGPAFAALSESLARKELLIHTESLKMATILQAMWRGYLVRKTYRPILNERMKEWRKEMSHKKHFAAAKLQACWKGYCVRQKVWPLLKQTDEQKIVNNQEERAAVVIQAHWRGHSCRSRYNQRIQHRLVSVRKDGILPNLSDASNSNDLRSGSSRLTVTQRLESALKLRTVETEKITVPYKEDSQSASQTGGMFGGEVLSPITSNVQENEEVELMGNGNLTLRHQGVAPQPRSRVRYAMTHRDSGKVYHCKEYESILIKHVREQEELGRQKLYIGVEVKRTMRTQNTNSSSITYKETSAAVLLQSVWRGRVARQSFVSYRCAVVRIQAVWRGVMVRRRVQQMKEERRKRIHAAIKIQAIYRGYLIRCKLCEVIKYAKCICEEEDYNLDEEIDINLRDYELLDEDIFPLSPVTPTSPPDSHYPVGYSPSPTQQHAIASHVEGKKQMPQFISETVPTRVPPGSILMENKQTASPSFTSSHSMFNSTLSTVPISVPPTLKREQTKPGEHILLPVNAWIEEEHGSEEHSGPTAQTPTTSNLTRTTEKMPKKRIVDEWGFKTDATAYLLMKRAKRQKMFKSKAAVRKKMADPAERLAAFQKQSHSALDTTFSVPCDYGHTERYPVAEGTRQYTKQATPYLYQWCHDHTVVHDDRLKELSKSKNEASIHDSSVSTLGSSSCSLPQLDRRVLAGHSPTLVGCDMFLSQLSSLKPSDYQGAGLQ